MAEHNETGQKGEDLAAEYLKNKGYAILETNYRFGNLEADIIATIGDMVIVAEVKTRKNNTFGEPEMFVTKQKQKNLIKAAHNYMIRYKINMEVRFDIVSVIMNSSGSTVNHIEGAFYPML